ncbi:helix-turn-helix domain-containing protein [Streptomyces shaanxiensis]
MGETEAERVKREVLGIGERRKHHTRKATPLKSHAKAPDTHHRLYRFRFYPTEGQADQLERTFGACRWVYNEGLALRSASPVVAPACRHGSCHRA